MFGLMVLGFYALYLTIWFGLVYGAWKLAKKFNLSKIITAIFLLIAFGIGYWPAFGDLIPTLRAHKQLCEKEAGFHVYVTPEQWAVENPGVLETLVPYEDLVKYQKGYLLNERIASFHSYEKIQGAAVDKVQADIIDIKSNQLLASRIDFSRGYGILAVGTDNRAIKTWLTKQSCFSDAEKIKNSNLNEGFYIKFKIN